MNKFEIQKHKEKLAQIVGDRFKGLVWDFDQELALIIGMGPDAGLW